MKTAIVYYSMSGNTEATAQTIAARIGADCIRIAPRKAYPDKGIRKFFWGGKSAVMGDKPPLEPYAFDADSYDRVIIGTPVWASRFTPPIRTFLSEHGEELQGKTLAIFVCCSGGGAQKAMEKLKAMLPDADWTAEAVLIDPLHRQNEENRAALDAFCDRLAE